MSSSQNKKNFSINPAPTSSDKDVHKLLLDIQQKINGSPALNGGFDTLLYKVDKIEECQGKIVDRIEEIHGSIYDPDKGLFARIAAANASQDRDYGEIDKKLVEINAWKKQVEKAEVEEKTAEKEITKKVEEQQKTIDSLSKWKDSSWALIKVSGIGLGGGIMSLFGKFIYDYITVHWKLPSVPYGACQKTYI
jgi:hypothetical protein